MLPLIGVLREYAWTDVRSDALAGVIVATTILPKSLALAQLAGMPPQMGLYASIFPLIVYGLLGSSRVVSVGPTAVVCLLVAATVKSQAATPSEAVGLVLSLALLVGLIHGLMALLRLGFLANLLSHPVIAGFTSGAGAIIILSQVKYLAGIELPRTEYPLEQLWALAKGLQDAKGPNVILGSASVVFLLALRFAIPKWLMHRGSAAYAKAIKRTAPLIVIVLAVIVSWGVDLERNVGLHVVGTVPSGLPALTAPEWSHWAELWPAALAIAFVAFVETYSVGAALAGRKRQAVSPNQELLALGVANGTASILGGLPVAGSLSGSAINAEAGASSGLASVFTGLTMLIAVAVLGPLLYHLPQAVLAALIIMLVFPLFDIQALIRAWRYDKRDAACLLVTLLAVLAGGAEVGILVGVATALVLFLWRTSRPHYAIVGRVGDSEHFRNVLRHEVTTHPSLLLLRFDESLYFANCRFLEELVTRLVAERSRLRHVVLICAGVNAIDISGVETLVSLRRKLEEAGVRFYLAEVKGPVMDRLRRSEFISSLDEERVFISTHRAFEILAGPTGGGDPIDA